MARTIEQQLAALRTLQLPSAKALEVLRETLRTERPGAGILAAAVGKLVGEHRLDALAPDLVTAFGVLLEQPVKRDPGCRGKIAIARALHELDRWDDRVFVVGLRVIQREGYANNIDDTAAALRGLCGLAHAQFARPDALDVLAALLADPERITRVAAAQGLGDSGRADATALLRYKLLVGDPEPEVLSACCESLFALAREGSVEFVVGLLPEHDDRADAAALALGGARLASALEPLVAWCAGCLPAQRHRTGYLALALLRSDAANAHLLDAIRTRSRGDAIAAARALATFKVDDAIGRQIRDALRAVTDQSVRLEIEALLA